MTRRSGVKGDGNGVMATPHVFSFLLIIVYFKQAQYQTHLKEMEAAQAGMPAVVVNHDNSDGPAVRDIHMENFNISVGGRDLIVDGCITLSFGRHYG